MILTNQLVGAGASLNTQATGDTDGQREQPIKVALKDVIDEPKAFKLDRDNSSGHVADFVPPQYGPPADNLNEKEHLIKNFIKDCLVSMEHLV